MRVVLTGASGFLGRHVLPRLAGHEVLCLTRDRTRIADAAGVMAVAADLTHDGPWTEVVSAFAPDVCVHLAWNGLPDYSLTRCRINLDAGVRLLSALCAAGVRRVVVAGSCWEYGAASGAVAEDAVPAGVGVFAASKLALLTMLQSVARESAFDYAWARVFFVYGPGQRSTSLVPSLRTAYAAGATPDVRQPGAVQDFIHVDDVAAAIVRLADPGVPSGVYNVGSGRPTSVAAVAAEVARRYGRGPLPAAHPGDGFWADTRRLESATGWRARIGLVDGIGRTLDEMDRRGESEEKVTC